MLSALFFFLCCFLFFFFNDTATTEIYTLSLHDALPISPPSPWPGSSTASKRWSCWRDRKSTRLNSSHTVISYAVFCLKKKKKMYEYHQKKKKNKTNTTQTTKKTNI